MRDQSALSHTATLIRALLRKKEGLVTVGICGSQGSGKSTLAEALVAALQREGIATATLSLDDLYLTRTERSRLADHVHPLFATRGVPGTHDTALGGKVMADLAAGEAVALPRFDKATDDRAPEALWPVSDRATRVLIFEGWCVGARPQRDTELQEPINALEREEDRAGVWRRHANAMLATDYQSLFDPLDCLVLLAAPSFDVVHAWRTEQEEKLRRSGPSCAAGLLDDAAMARFIQHYERLTRHILSEMPGRADLTINLDAQRQVRSVTLR